MLPLDDIVVLDLSHDPAGWAASLLLAEAGAHVSCIQDADQQPDQRFLNSKTVVDPGDDRAGVVADLISKADVVLETRPAGRPGRIALGQAGVRQLNENAIYCEIASFAAESALARHPGGMMSHWCETGLLDLFADGGVPPFPPAGISEIGAGAFPAVINILIALRVRERTGNANPVTIAISDAMLSFAYDRVGDVGVETWRTHPRAGIYETIDQEYVAVDARDDRIWENLCERLELDDAMRDGSSEPRIVKETLGAIFRARSAKFWRDKFENRDLGCLIVEKFEERANLRGGVENRKQLNLPLAAPFRRSTADSG